MKIFAIWSNQTDPFWCLLWHTITDMFTRIGREENQSFHGDWQHLDQWVLPTELHKPLKSFSLRVFRSVCAEWRMCSNCQRLAAVSVMNIPHSFSPHIPSLAVQHPFVSRCLSVSLPAADMEQYESPVCARRLQQRPKNRGGGRGGESKSDEGVCSKNPQALRLWRVRVPHWPNELKRAKKRVFLQRSRTHLSSNSTSSFTDRCWRLPFAGLSPGPTWFPGNVPSSLVHRLL